MTPLEQYEAALAVANRLSQDVVDRYGASAASNPALDGAIKDRDAAISDRDEAIDAANEWRRTYEDFVARAASDMQRLSTALAELTGPDASSSASAGAPASAQA